MNERLYKRWTPEQKEVLVKMFHAGCTVSEMCEVLQRDQTVVRGRLYLMGLRLSDRSIEPDMEAFERIMRLRTGEDANGCNENVSSSETYTSGQE